MACDCVCPHGAINVVDSLHAINASIDTSKCIKCGLCFKVCQVNEPLLKKEPILWKQGWASNEIRQYSSSGGFAAAITDSFISKQGIVYSCAFTDGHFGYLRCSNHAETKGLKGSKYVKSNPNRVYQQVKNDLDKGLSVLFIGLPCHAAGLKKYLNIDYDSLFLIDLICHGTPSPKLLDCFLRDYSFDLNTVNSISFRHKNSFYVSVDGVPIIDKNIKDPYMLGFLSGLFYTENCYDCAYASTSRISDLTIGDSWGSEFVDEISNGVSLVLCMTEKGLYLLNNTQLELFDVNIDNAIKSNQQLRNPSIKPEKRSLFFKGISSGRSFTYMIYKAYPKAFIKQFIKYCLSRIGLLNLFYRVIQG